MKKRVISYLIAVTMVLSVLLSSVSCDMSAFEQILAAPTEDELASITDTDSTANGKNETEVETDIETEVITVTETTNNKRPSSQTTEEKTTAIANTEKVTFAPNSTDRVEETTVFETVSNPIETNTGKNPMPDRTESGSAFFPEETETCVEIYPDDTDEINYPEDSYYPLPPEEEESYIEGTLPDENYPEDSDDVSAPDNPLDPVPPEDNYTYAGEELFVLAPKERTNKFYVHGMDNAYNVLAESAIRRNQEIQAIYGISIINKYVDHYADMNSLIEASFMSGDGDVDVFISPASRGISEYFTKGQLFDFNNLGIDLYTQHWQITVMENLSVEGQLFAGFGNMLATDTDVILFNKDMANQYLVEDMYELVFDGKWTLEAFKSAINEVYCDLNGNGVANYGDQFGLLINYKNGIDSFVFSSDINPIFIDGASGERSLNIDQKFYGVFNFIDNMIETSISVYNTDPDSITDAFNKSYSLFNLVNMSDIGDYVNAEFDYGILPYPKADLDQDEYMSLYKGGYICVLASIDNPDFIGAALDRLNYHSADIEASMLWQRVCRSVEDMTIMGFIRRGIVSDFARVFERDPLFTLSFLFPDTLSSNRPIQAEVDAKRDMWEAVIHSYLS